MELEERSIEKLPERCSNCGATLTREEKQRIHSSHPARLGSVEPRELGIII